MVIGDTEDEEKLIGSGVFGLMVYECKTKSKTVKRAGTDKGYIGINYIPHLKLILAATQKSIKFFNAEDLDDDEIRVRNHEIDELDTTLTGQYLSDIAVSDRSVSHRKKLIAMGDDTGQIQVWRIDDLHINIPCAIL